LPKSVFYLKNTIYFLIDSIFSIAKNVSDSKLVSRYN
jgi:hypothetical protein